MKIRAYGSVGVFEAQGSYQLYVEKMEPTGLGDLHLAFEQLKRKLQEEGLFENTHKQVLPRFPKRIGIATSDTGAAIRDIVNVISRRYPMVRLLLYPVRVQGEGAAGEIAGAIRFFQTLPPSQKPDLLIIGRGGGSLEDLWAFNEEIVARAIFECCIPVISAVGHEIDFTISDFVADKRAPTPSAGAEMAVPDSRYLLEMMTAMSDRIVVEHRKFLDLLQYRLDHRGSSELFKPQRVLEEYKLRLDYFATRLSDATARQNSESRQMVQELGHRLTVVGPQHQVMERSRALNRLANRFSQAVRETIQENRTAVAHLTQVMSGFNLDRFRVRLDILSAKHHAFNPRGVLSRGYAICTRPDGTIVTSYKDVRIKGRVEIELEEGQLGCKVEDKRFL